MKKVDLDDISGNAAYEKVREKSRQRVIELKRRRRISVGDQVSLVFENRDTVIFQIQEMMRAEKISDLTRFGKRSRSTMNLSPHPGSSALRSF